MASEVTLLPQPDSPTSPSVAPLATLRSTLSTAWVMRPSSPWNMTRKSLMSISGTVRHCPARNRGFDRGVDDRAIGDAGGILRASAGTFGNAPSARG